MLQQMRGLAKYIWVLVALFFVGGFLLYQTSGLLGRTPITPTTAVAVVNGHEILYQTYMNRVQQEMQSEQQQQGRTLTEDDNRRIENTVFDQMVNDILLQDEYKKRGIVVTDDEVREFARYAPPPWITSAPELQTDGKFDPDKYQRLLASAQARESGLLVSLEQYYRTEVPREKLFDQIASGVYVTDAELWRAWRDQHDSAQASYVAWLPGTPDANTVKAVSDDEARAYFDQHKTEFEGPGRASLSLIVIHRVVTAADSAAAKAHAQALRDSIADGKVKFEDAAKSESADTASGSNGGDLGKQPASAYVPEFSKAAEALKVGELSEPVLSPFGYHIIRLDSRSGDTLGLHHILIRIQASDSATARTDKEADEVSKLAAQSEEGAKLDSASKQFGLPVNHITVFEDEPATLNGQPVPSVSAWAFGGAKPGETSDLYDDDNGYYLARLDSIRQGGEPTFDNVKDAVKARVAVLKTIDDKLMPQAQKFASAAAGSSMEAAAQQQGLQVQQTGLFARTSIVPGLGQFSEPVGAAFGLPVGAVSQPIKSADGVFVIRTDKRVVADSATWAAQKEAQRTARIQQLRTQRVQMFMQDLRNSAKIDDRRKQINAETRRQSA
ncbi:MAG TPA: peptidyl-prolyl cis-trans isomerase [Gemmatimonadaceae bacterium]|nr:peptidyl-prolyl cis-trans isomerase [Gemmatimonadaceae bacterium]